RPLARFFVWRSPGGVRPYPRRDRDGSRTGTIAARRSQYDLGGSLARIVAADRAEWGGPKRGARPAVGGLPGGGGGWTRGGGGGGGGWDGGGGWKGGRARRSDLGVSSALTTICLAHGTKGSPRFNEFFRFFANS